MLKLHQEQVIKHFKETGGIKNRSILEQKACAFRHKSLDSQEKSRALVKVWDEISPEMIARILKYFQKRLDACIEAKGDHFECDM